MLPLAIIRGRLRAPGQPPRLTVASHCVGHAWPKRCRWQLRMLEAIVKRRDGTLMRRCLVHQARCLPSLDGRRGLLRSR